MSSQLNCRTWKPKQFSLVRHNNYVFIFQIAALFVNAVSCFVLSIKYEKIRDLSSSFIYFFQSNYNKNLFQSIKINDITTSACVYYVKILERLNCRFFTLLLTRYFYVVFNVLSHLLKAPRIWLVLHLIFLQVAAWHFMTFYDV